MQKKVSSVEKFIVLSAVRQKSPQNCGLLGVFYGQGAAWERMKSAQSR